MLLLALVIAIMPEISQNAYADDNDSSIEYVDIGKVEEGKQLYVQVPSAKNTYFKLSADVPEDGWYRLYYPDSRYAFSIHDVKLDNIDTFVPYNEPYVCQYHYTRIKILVELQTVKVDLKVRDGGSIIP